MAGTAEVKQVPQEAAQPQPRFFEFGDAFFECNRCGNYEMIDRGIKDGLQFVLPTSDQHEWRLVCGKCKNMMRVFFKESTEDTIKEAKAKIAEAEKKKAEEEAVKKANEEEAKNESKKKDKKKRSSKRNSKDSAGVSESDGTGEPALTVVD